MRFSIIVPIYNKQDYLLTCIESIQKQTYSDFECILVDDGSWDHSGQIAKEISVKDNRFKYIYKKNGGLVSARKTGIEHAKGEYIINIDADDFVKNDFLERINNEVEKHKPDTICFQYTLFEKEKFNKAESEQVIGCFEGKLLKKVLESYLYDFSKKHINSGSILFNICMKAIKRDLYVKSQLKVDNKITSGEDTVFSFYWCFNTKKICCIDYHGYYYRQADSSIEHTFNMECFNNLEFVYKEMKRINYENSGHYQKNIEAYLFYRLERYLYILAQSSNGMKDYLDKVSIVKKSYPNLWDFNFNISMLKITNKIRYIFVKRKMWKIIYFLGNTKYKGKLI